MRSPGLRHPARAAGTSLLRLQSDERLAELAGSGHESAFDAIVDRYRTPLTRYCAGIVGPSRAEDAVQQALINAHDALQRTDEVRNLRSWLYRIAHNAALNVLRAVRDDVPLDEQTLHATRGGAAARVAAAAGPEESFERSEEFRSTLAALQALPDRQRAALVLRELEGRSHEEIAAALGVTKGSARQHLMRARVAVRSAVTAVTPYPLVARLAEWTSAGAGAGAPAWVDGAATAGAGASLAKLTAGLAATGALVGGAVGTEHVVRGGADAGSATPRSAERAPERGVKRAGGATVVPAAAVTRGGTASGSAGGAGRDGAPSRSSSSSSSARRGARRASPPKKGAVTPAAAAEPGTSSASAPAHREDAAAGTGPATGRKSEKQREGKASHGRETSRSHRSENAAGGGGKSDKKAAKDEKHPAKKEDKGEPPGQAKKPAPSPSTPSSSSKGSHGKGSDGTGNGSGAKGSDDPGSTAAQEPAGTSTIGESLASSTTATPSPSDDED